MKVALLALLIAGCAHTGQPCLTKPPPMLHDHAAECLAIPEKDVRARLQCAFDAIPTYVHDSEAWETAAWKKCGP